MHHLFAEKQTAYKNKKVYFNILKPKCKIKKNNKILIFYFFLFYFILFYFILFYFILFYFILFYFILFYFILFYFILFYFIILKYKDTSKVVSNSDSTSDAESGMNPSLAISQLINNTLNNEDSSLKIINLHDTERTYALKKRIYDLLNPSEKETQSDKTSASIENTERKTDNDNNVENKESGNENEMDIDKVEKIENNIDDLKLNLEEYGLPKETDDKCDQELQVIQYFIFLIN